MLTGQRALSHCSMRSPSDDISIQPHWTRVGLCCERGWSKGVGAEVCARQTRIDASWPDVAMDCLTEGSPWYQQPRSAGSRSDTPGEKKGPTPKSLDKSKRQTIELDDIVERLLAERRR